ncbi:hypothetical protein Tco_1110237 [Tanacetum coccineum]|uniref:Uncharacterized protein n=1 Tax=Tanacetum coccineum TaxID=301880 RepID=A0ABQ5III4_9ASTR
MFIFITSIIFIIIYTPSSSSHRSSLLSPSSSSQPPTWGARSFLCHTKKGEFVLIKTPQGCLFRWSNRPPHRVRLVHVFTAAGAVGLCFRCGTKGVRLVKHQKGASVLWVCHRKERAALAVKQRGCVGLLKTTKGFQRTRGASVDSVAKVHYKGMFWFGMGWKTALGMVNNQTGVFGFADFTEGWFGLREDHKGAFG